MRVAAGQTVLILASQHLQTVVNTLVNQPLPYDRYIYKIIYIYIYKVLYSACFQKRLFLVPVVCFFNGRPKY